MLSIFSFVAMPFGQIPVLEVDGKRVYQSTSIARYVTKLVGLAGADDWESLLIDIAVDNMNDFDSSECSRIFATRKEYKSTH